MTGLSKACLSSVYFYIELMEMWRYKFQGCLTPPIIYNIHDTYLYRDKIVLLVIHIIKSSIQPSALHLSETAQADYSKNNFVTAKVHIRYTYYYFKDI